MKAPAKRRKYGLNVWKAHLKIDAMHIEAMYDGSIVKDICTGSIGNNWKEIKRKILNRKRRKNDHQIRLYLFKKQDALRVKGTKIFITKEGSRKWRAYRLNGIWITQKAYGDTPNDATSKLIYLSQTSYK